MTDMISVLIVDDNAELCNSISAYLGQCNDFVVKGIAEDGIVAIKMIEELLPDVVLLDLIMPNLDGLGVLERFSKRNIRNKPIFIVISAVGNDTFVREALGNGADYFIMKPFEMNILTNRIRQLYNDNKKSRIKKTQKLIYKNEESTKKKKRNLEQIVTVLIRGLGITPNITGYQYLREAVMILAEEPALQSLIGKCIFQGIADRHNTEPRNVDRAIRCALDNAFKKMSGNGLVDDSAMPEEFNNRKKRTNSRVINLLAEKARREMNLS